MERELDDLIDSLSYDLHSPRLVRRSRIDDYWKDLYVTRSPIVVQSDHRDYIYDRYGRSKSPRLPRRSTLERGWYSTISKDMGTPRTPTPILKRRTNSPPRASSRPSSALSWSDDYHYQPQSRPTSPSRSYYESAVSPRFRSMSPTRSYSPKNEKSVVIGPVTELVTKQEYFRGRDSQQGKPLSGRHGFMTGSWPYGLNNIEDLYANRNNRKPASSPPPPRVPSPPIVRRAKSVEPPIVRNPLPPPVSCPSSPIPDYMRHLKHIVVEQIAVPVPPKFGTLLPNGQRRPNVAEGPVFNGPPCELCHKAITERRCIYAENAQYHCWHFVCSFCSKTLKDNDFTMAEDNKPYCLNCFKRMYPM